MTKQTLNILLVEDEEAHAEAVRRAFEPTHGAVRLEHASTLREALDHIEKSVPDLVIADWVLPDGKGTDILPSDKELRPFPLVLMTSYGNEELAVSTMKAGVLDYVVKSPATFANMPHIARRALREWNLLLENKRAQQALRESERRFRMVFEESRDCIFLKDRSLRYVDVNPSCERLVGLPASKFVGLRYENVFGPEGADHIREVETRVLSGETIEEENTRTINGVLMTFLDTRVPWRDDSGNIIGLLGISRDITDRKRTEVSFKCMEGYPSKAMRATLRKALIAAGKPSTILLTGESGSGKDYLAKYIHDHSDRAGGPYFAVNCAAISPELAESELFGHEKGAFTGAAGRKRGMVELAEGGTLLLNEIGDLSLPLQAKLLAFLDTKKFTRVGGEKEISVNARLIAATNRDLEKAVHEGHFRKDLFYRLNVIRIEVPQLRERLADIPTLVGEIALQLASEMQLTSAPELDQCTMDALVHYHWPGNVRELRNVLERALILSGGERFDVLSPALREGTPERESTLKIDVESRTLREVTDEVTRAMLVSTLERCKGNKKQTAKMLGISRDTLYRYLADHGIDQTDTA